MKDIAKDLGISVMTVSKALRNHQDVSTGIRNRVSKRARQLDYRPNWVARALVTGRTYMGRLIIPDLMHSFFAEVAKGVARVLAPRCYHLIISNSEENPGVERREIEAPLAQNVDGLIVASAQKDARWLRRNVRTRRPPCVLSDRVLTGFDVCYVGVDDVEIGALATRHLIEQGCRRIAHIRAPAVSTARGCLRGYRRTLVEHGLKAPPEYVVSGQHQEATGHGAMRQLLRLNPQPDGVFCYNDPVAAGGIKAVFEAGLNVPNDIAIIGAGNVHCSDLLSTPLSTVDQNSSAIGETAAELIMQCMEAKTPCRPRSILIPVRLVVPESSRRRS
jgi:LacI family transcriptional regulator